MEILMKDSSEISIKKAVMLRGDTSENLIGLLERRLDAVSLQSKDFLQQYSQPDNLINHGHVKVNGKKVNISSYVNQRRGHN